MQVNLDGNLHIAIESLTAVIGVGRQASTEQPGGLDLLEQRYARGEVNREEYLQKKGDLQA
jgi:uncharacterized membrane protein